MSELTQANRESLNLATEMHNRLFGQESICVAKIIKEAAESGSLMSISTKQCLQYPTSGKEEINDLVTYAFDAINSGKRVELSCKDDAYGDQACVDFKSSVDEFLAGLIEAPSA